MKLGEMKYDNFFIGDSEVNIDTAKVKADTIINAFSILTIDSEGFVAEATSAELEEGLSIYGLSLEEASPIGEDGETVIMLTGGCNQDAINYPDGTSYKDFKVQLRNLNIFLKEPMEG